MPLEQAKKEWEDSTAPAPKTVERGGKKRTYIHDFRRFGDALAWLDWSDDIIEIRKVESFLNAGNGGPSRLLKFLQTIADKHGLRIFAGIRAYPPDPPAPKGKLLNPQELEAWYARCGFQIVRDRCGAYGWYPTAPKE